MTQLMQYDVDYRIIYIAEDEFRSRVENAYIAKQTAKSPPVFHELLDDLITVEVKLFVEHHPEVFTGQGMSEEEVKSLLHAIDAEDYHAIAYVSELIDPRHVEMFARDLLLFLVHNQWFFLEKDVYSNDYLFTYNSPLAEVW